jgi:hypothetical protein
VAKDGDIFSDCSKYPKLCPSEDAEISEANNKHFIVA